MEIQSINVSPSEDGKILMLNGKLELTPAEVVKAAQLSGNYHESGFQKYIQDLLVRFLEGEKIPRSHDTVVCLLSVAHETDFRQWEFQVIAISRFL